MINHALKSGLMLLVGLVVGSLFGACTMTSEVSGPRYDRALTLVEEGTQHLRAGRLEEASTAFAAAEELAPIAASVDGQGCVALLRGDVLAAERLFRQAFDMDGSYDEALAHLALSKDISGRKQEAKVLYDQVISLLPMHEEARNNRAALEYDRGVGKMEVSRELEKARLIGDHPVVAENIKRLKLEQCG